MAEDGKVVFKYGGDTYCFPLECYHLSRVDKHPKSDKIEIRRKVIEDEKIQ
jgi:hypothetical protein